MNETAAMTPVRFHQPERHPLHHLYSDFSAAIDRGAPDDELIDMLEQATRPVLPTSEQIKEGEDEEEDVQNPPYKLTMSLPEDLQADAGAGITSQDFQDNLKTSIKKAHALLSANTSSTTKNDTRNHLEEESEIQNLLTMGSAYEFSVANDPLKTTARSDAHINEMYEALAKQLGAISIDVYSAYESGSGAMSTSKSSSNASTSTLPSSRPKRRGRRPAGA